MHRCVQRREHKAIQSARKMPFLLIALNRATACGKNGQYRNHGEINPHTLAHDINKARGQVAGGLKWLLRIDIIFSA